MTYRVLMSALFVLTSAVTPLRVFADSKPSVGSLAPEFIVYVAGRHTRQPEGLSRQVGGLVLLPQGLHQGLRNGPEPYQAARRLAENDGEVRRGIDL